MSLSAGSIAFTGFNADGNDNLSFVALTDIPQGTVINFTDSNWDGANFAVGSNAESTIAWTATSAIPAGTVIDINNIGKGTFGTSAGSATFTNANNTGLSNDSEVVYAYVGTSTSPTFLAAISNVGYATSDGTLTGTGLVAGQTAVSFTGGLDIAGYTGQRFGLANFADYLAAIGDTGNWVTQNGSGDQSADGNTPDAPFPTTAFTVAPPAAQLISFSPSSVSIVEGDNGTKTMTFTIVRSGSTTGVASFSGSFAAGTTNAADYGGTLPAPTFSGTIADGATSATVTVTISGDTTPEADESFTLTLTSVSNPSAVTAIGTATATGTITKDDGTVLSGNSSTPVTLANNDPLVIFSGTLSGSTPVTWIGGSTSPGALVDNSGTIIGASRAIYTSGSASGSFTVSNEFGATITATKDAVKISNLVSGTSGTFTVYNQGLISSTGTGSNGGQALDLDDINSSGARTVITNWSSGVIAAADADAIRAGANATINNYGQIVSHNASAASDGNDAIDFQSVNAGGVINNYAGGTIDGARHGITGDQPITVNNIGTITGEAGSGINMDSAANTTTVVTNRGAITGTSVNRADADGIDVDGLVSIENFGTIKAVGLTSGANGLNEALAIGGGSVRNRADGLIVSDQRAITVDDSNNGSAFGAMTIINDGTIRGNNGEAISIVGTFGDTVTNTGGIFGSVATDGGNDTLTNSGSITGSIDMGGGNDALSNIGVITGDVSMGAGDDSFTLVGGSSVTGAHSAVTGTIDGGTGNDTLTLSGWITLSDTRYVGTVINVENLDVQGGHWSIQDNRGYSYVKLDSASTVSFSGVGSSLVGKTIYNEGKIEGGDPARAAINILGGFDDIITNKGNITGGIFSDGGADTLTNSGSIVAISGYAIKLGDGADTIATTGSITGSIDMGGGADTLTNSGSIAATSGYAINLGDGADAIATTGSITGGIDMGGGADTLTNSGLIAAKFDSVIKLGDGDDTVANTRTITSSINMGSGNDALSNKGVITGDVSMGAGDDSIALFTGLRLNGLSSALTGTIDGGTGNDTLNLSGTGYNIQLGAVINVENLDVQSGNWNARAIANYSYIKIESGATAYFIDTSPSLGATTIYSEGGITSAISILGSFADTITNKGNMTGGIFTDGGGDTLTNSGLIVVYSGSAIDLGDGDDTFTNTGIVAGGVRMGAGNDTINLFTGSTIAGTIDGGEGNDTINLSGLGSSTLGKTIGVENLDVRSGNWATSAGMTYSFVTVETGASLFVQGQSSSSAGTVAQGAALYVYGRSDGAAVRGEQWVVGNGKANGTILDGGSQNVYGAVVTQTTIGNGGVQYLHGSAITTILNNGGGQNVYSDGTATGTTINTGGVQNDWGTTSGTTLEGGVQYVFGRASTTILNSGLQVVETGGGANATTIHGGDQVVFAGGTATGTTMDGGSQQVYGAVVTQTTIGNGAIQHLHGSAITTILNNGGGQNVYSDGTATGTTINAGGVQVDWGAASATIVNGGVQYVYGSATGTSVLAGTQQVQSGGSADDTTIGSGALAFVHAGGTMDDVIFAGANASLVLAQASALTGTISGWQDHDSIDLGDILFSDDSTSLAYSQNNDNTGGTLTVSDGTHVATLHLLGQYTAADFAIASDGHGGTLLTDPALAPQVALAPALHG
ncbi:beta strand repeat-containing protein [Bradyrhizobium sp. Pa8]|uniref:beta strand repeat-containing protein n=1 Tax=Bradyrhizobium sp. Pa8 TaxID=3386552 RepID=UPI00403FBA3B